MRIADTAPAYCSGCFQAKPSEVHVDFDVAWDGPTITEGLTGGDGEVTNSLTVAIDDLILCSGCVRAAAAHVGMVDPDKLADELEQLREGNRNLTERLRGAEDYASKMEAAVASKPQPRKRQPAGVS